MASDNSVGVIIVVAKEHDAAYLRTSCTLALVPGSALKISLQTSVLSWDFVNGFLSLLVDMNSLPVLILGDLRR